MYVLKVNLSLYSCEMGNVKFYGYHSKENAIKAFEETANKYLREMGFAPIDFANFKDEDGNDTGSIFIGHNTEFTLRKEEYGVERYANIDSWGSFHDCIDVEIEKIDGDNIYVVCDDCSYVQTNNEVYTTYTNNENDMKEIFHEKCINAIVDFDEDCNAEELFEKVLKEKEIRCGENNDMCLERYSEHEFGLSFDLECDREFIFYQKVDYVD